MFNRHRKRKTKLKEFQKIAILKEISLNNDISGIILKYNISKWTVYTLKKNK